MNTLNKDELVKRLDVEEMEDMYCYTCQAECKYLGDPDECNLKWQIHLLPKNGIMTGIAQIIEIVRGVNPSISVWVTTYDGGCLMIY